MRKNRWNLLGLGLISSSFLSIPRVAFESAQEHPGQEHPKAEKEENMKTETVDPIAAIEKFIAEKKVDKTKDNWKSNLPKPEKQKFDAKTNYFWHMKTNKGSIKIKLMPEVAPMHVTSTIYLTKLGFYDNVVFHRVIQGFMAQGGDPTGTGRGGPGYKYEGEFSPEVKHNKPGLLSMANAGPGTDGSQFFLTFVPTPHLDGKHTIFGEVVGTDGMETLKSLEKSGSRGGPTTEKLVIETASISVEPIKAD